MFASAIIGGRDVSKLCVTPSDYDSDDDDPERLVACRIKVKWQGEKWYAGVIEQYDSDPCSITAGKHLVTYDDGDKKWYNLGEKTFEIV